ncbi:guanine permease [Endozoicomonas montiporae]|uniref:Guanine permease n=2 Tax=Endozoicomonas montiporae TaxID=1027273 RepID=A0A081N4H1_9GAMM|nr:NCS2 family permease [Endozoicomonas montiporae]AMO57800.1 xanthine/uracil/vitamin C permease [Endozoicomonas montiporae CL-33]KEQ13344.1 guanine permease [Endozoicomonas montiporae]
MFSRESLDRFFGLKAHGTDIKTEVIAGFTTFMTMAYILIVNPLILKDAGMDFGAVFSATAISAIIGTLVMALWAKLPFALAPGMGLNAFFAYGVVLGMGYSWQMALTAILLEGIIFLILTALNIREAIVNSIPLSLKKAVSCGIGLFIAFIGLQNSGIVVANDATMVAVGALTDPKPLLALIGILITGVMLVKGVQGALLIGIFATTIIGIPMGVTSLPDFSNGLTPPDISPIFFQFQWDQVFTIDMVIILFTFLFVDMFDTVGTLVGVSTKADMLTEEGEVPNCKQALFADAIATTAGACLGTSTVTTFVESASGVSAGGRTGLTSLTVAGLFLIALFLSPLFLMVPGAATAPALVLVGLFMMSPIKEIDLDDFSESIPAFLTLLFMPLTYSIAEGIIIGMLSYIGLKALSGNARQVSIISYIVGVLCLAKLAV